MQEGKRRQKHQKWLPWYKGSRGWWSSSRKFVACGILNGLTFPYCCVLSNHGLLQCSLHLIICSTSGWLSRSACNEKILCFWFRSHTNLIFPFCLFAVATHHPTRQLRRTGIAGGAAGSCGAHRPPHCGNSAQPARPPPRSPPVNAVKIEVENEQENVSVCHIFLLSGHNQYLWSSQENPAFSKIFAGCFFKVFWTTVLFIHDSERKKKKKKLFR